MVDRIAITSRDQWLAERAKDVTASAAGALLGVHEYQTPFGLWALKSGKVAEDSEVSPAMQRGLLLEPVALKLYQADRPQVHIDWNGTPGEVVGGIYSRDPNTRVGATIDAFAHDQRGPGIVQFKNVEANIFRSKWLGDAEPGEDRPVEVPLWIAVQAIIEADLAEAKWAQVAAMVVGHGIDLHVIEVPIHQGVLDQVRAKTADFWRRVRDNDPPPADYGRDGETIGAIYKSDKGTTIDLRGDNRIPELLEKREKLAADRKEAQMRLDEIRAELQLKMGDNAIGLANGWTISNKTVNRSAYSVAATSYRTIRSKRIAANG